MRNRFNPLTSRTAQLVAITACLIVGSAAFAAEAAPGDSIPAAEAETAAAVDVHTPVSADDTAALVVEEEMTVEVKDGYLVPEVRSATRSSTPLLLVPQAISVVSQQLIADQQMTSMGDVVRYLPGIAMHQGENNRDQVVIRGNSSSADFFVDGMRDDVQYYRDVYNLERVEALKGSSALAFGRGGAGGVINRVTKAAGFAPLRRADLQGGSFGQARATVDLDQPLGQRLAVRLNAMIEDSDSFRDAVDLQRSGVAPSLTFLAGDDTMVTLGYEHFADRRVADRGITSYRGRPADVPIDTYYGDPDQSRVRADVDLASATVEHRVGDLVLRNRTLAGDYRRFYQNFVPGAASADGTLVALSAYNNATDRRNLFNQTDLELPFTTGALRHQLVAGVDLGRQLTDNFRNTGYFDDRATSIQVPFASPTVTTPVTFRQSATDADNHVRAQVAAVFVQDQVELTRRVRLLAGLRFERFDLDYTNNRNGERLGRVDDLLSPRAGIVVEPLAGLSLYGSWSVSYVPGSGDQFASLTNVTKQLEPERIDSYEIGTKWQASPSLLLTAALYRLDRTNTRSTDPNDPTRIVQTGSQRTDGWEVGVTGEVNPRWSIAGGYAHQLAEVTRPTVTARAGAVVPLVPRHALSLWNNVELHPRLRAALGVVYRSEVFAAIDNTVTLPAYTRFDAALFLTMTSALRLQVNVENLLDERYWDHAGNNTNLSPGSPRAISVGVTAKL